MRPAARRRAVEEARQRFGLSERRACAIFAVDRTSVRYAPRRGDDGDLRSRLREIASERRRFGYRRLGIMLARESIIAARGKPLMVVSDNVLCREAAAGFGQQVSMRRQPSARHAI